MKKLNLLAIALLPIITLTACNDDDKKSSSSASKPTQPTTTTTPNPPKPTPTTPTPVKQDFALTSSAFKNGGVIPTEFACIYMKGQNTSLPLEWKNAPKDTAKFAVIMDDETPPCESGDNACPHWSVYNIPSSVTSIAKGQSVSTVSTNATKVDKLVDVHKGVVEGMSYEVGYAGMCPPNKHTYKVSVFALKSSMPTINQDKANEILTRSKFKKLYASHIVGESTISGTFTPSN